jgi:hypothetical protein
VTGDGNPYPPSGFGVVDRMIFFVTNHGAVKAIDARNGSVQGTYSDSPSLSAQSPLITGGMLIFDNGVSPIMVISESPSPSTIS